MYLYKTRIAQIDDICGGLEAGTNILVLAPPMSYAEQLAYALTKPDQGEYSIVLSTNERASEVIDFFKLAQTDKEDAFGLGFCHVDRTQQSAHDPIAAHLMFSLDSALVRFYRGPNVRFSQVFGCNLPRGLGAIPRQTRRFRSVAGFDVEFYKSLLARSQNNNNLLFNNYYYTAHTYP